jgi:glycosyltransferase involved in cell wall biosynthesis
VLVPKLSGGVGHTVKQQMVGFAEILRSTPHIIILRASHELQIDEKRIRLHHSLLYRTKLHVYLSLPLDWLLCLYCLYKIKPTCVISHGLLCNIINSLLKLWFGQKIKTVLFEHSVLSVHLKNTPKMSFIKKGLVKHFYGRNDLIIGVSSGVVEELVATASTLARSKTFVLGTLFNFEAIKEKAREDVELNKEFCIERTKVIATAGRLTEQKDHHTLLNAFNILRKRASVFLIIMGDGPLKKRLQMQSRQLGLDNLVVFLGQIENPWKYIKASDVFVLSSTWESFGNVLVEALFLGKPIVSTDCPYGPRDILDNGKYGILAKVGDPEDIANKIESLLKAPDKCEAYSRLGPRRAELYRKDVVINKLVEKLAEL